MNLIIHQPDRPDGEGYFENIIYEVNHQYYQFFFNRHRDSIVVLKGSTLWTHDELAQLVTNHPQRFEPEDLGILPGNAWQSVVHHPASALLEVLL